MTATNEIALHVKHSARPSTAASTPPTAAPNTRAMFSDTELRVTAFREVLRRDHLRDEASAWPGLSKTFTKPSDSASHVYQPQLDDVASRFRMAKTPASRPDSAWVTYRIRRLLRRSANRPPARAEQQDRQEAGRRDEAEVGPAVREVQDEEGLGHRLHPGTHHGDKLPEEVQAVVPVAAAMTRSVPGLNPLTLGFADRLLAGGAFLALVYR